MNWLCYGSALRDCLRVRSGGVAKYFMAVQRHSVIITSLVRSYIPTFPGKVFRDDAVHCPWVGGYIPNLLHS